MSLLDLIGLAVVAFLVSFLYRKCEARICHIGERALPGKGIDLTHVSERIQHVRADYLAAISARPHDIGRRQRLHAAARCALKRLAYFQHTGPETEDAPPHEANTHPG